MRSKGSRFTLGVWGLRVCSLDVAFTVATVRNRPREDRMAAPMVSSAEVVIFGGFRCLVASFRVAGVALRDIQRCFVMCRKSFCVAGAILLRRFQTMCCSFRGRRSTLDVSIVILRGRRSTLDVSRCVFFCESHCQGCVKWRQGANSVAGVAFCDMCWSLTEASHETSILTLQNLEVPTKTRRKTSILKLQSVKIGGSLARNARFGAPTCLVSGHWFSGGFAVSMGEAAKHVLSACFKLWKLEEVSHTMLILVFLRVSFRVSGFPVASPCLWGKLQNVSFSFLFEDFQAGCHVVLRGRRGTLWHSNLFDNVSKMSNLEEVSHEMLVFLHPCVFSRVSGFPVRRRVYGGSCKTCPFVMLPTAKIAGSLVRNAGFSASTCLVSSRWFSCGVAVSMGKAGKHLLFECAQAGCHVVLRGRHATLWHSNLFDNVSKISKLEEVSHEMLVFLHPRVLSRVSGFPVASPCLWGKLENISYSNVPKQVVMSFCVAGVALCDIPTCLITCRKYQNSRKSRTKCSFFCTHVSRLESLVFLWRRRVYGGSSALHSLHFTLHTLHFALSTPHSSLYTLHSTLYTLHSTLHTLHFTLHTPHSRLYTLHSTPHTLHSKLLTLHSTLHTPHFPLHTPHSTLHTLHSTLYTPHSTLYTFTLHSTLHTLHFTLYTLHSTLHTPHSTLYTLHSTLSTLHSTLHTLHYTLHFPLSTPHSTLYTPHSTLYTLHSTPHTLHSTLHTLHSTLHTSHSTLHTLHFNTPHSTLSTPHCRLVTRETCTRLFK